MSEAAGDVAGGPVGGLGRRSPDGQPRSKEMKFRVNAAERAEIVAAAHGEGLS